MDGCLARVGRPSILSRPAIANRLDHHGESNDQLGMAAARTETQKPLPRGTGARPSAGIKFAEMLLALPLDSRPHFAAIDVGNRSRPIVMADVSEICEAVYGSQAPYDETKGPDDASVRWRHHEDRSQHQRDQPLSAELGCIDLFVMGRRLSTKCRLQPIGYARGVGFGGRHPRQISGNAGHRSMRKAPLIAAMVALGASTGPGMTARQEMSKLGSFTARSRLLATIASRVQTV